MPLNSRAILYRPALYVDTHSVPSVLKVQAVKVDLNLIVPIEDGKLTNCNASVSGLQTLMTLDNVIGLSKF